MLNLSSPSIIAPFPINGISQDIDESIKPGNYSDVLSNFTQDKLGRGVLRFGTKLAYSAPPSSEIMRLFVFPEAGDAKLAAYYSSVTIDDHATEMRVLDGVFLFNTAQHHIGFYNAGDMMVVYTGVVDRPVRHDVSIKSITVTHGHGDIRLVSITFDELTFAPDQLFVNVGWLTGSFGFWDNQRVFRTVKTGLSANCIPRSVFFRGYLIVCNGVDRMFSFDGQNAVDIKEYVADPTVRNVSNVINQPRVITFSCSSGANVYDGIQTLKIINGNQSVTVPVVSVTRNGANVSVTCGEDVPVVGAETRLHYPAYAPICNFLSVHKNIMLGLGSGAAGIAYRSSPGETLKIYMLQGVKDAALAHISYWTSEASKTYLTADLSANHGDVDNFEAIAHLGDSVFISGRKKTQVGTIQGREFILSEVIDTGVIHGDLVLNAPTDIYFVDRSGLNSAGSRNTSQQLAVTSVTAVNTQLKEFISTMMGSNKLYRRSFAYKSENPRTFGFKIGESPVIHILHGNAPYFFSLFTGDFSASSHIVNAKERIMLASGSSVLLYEDGGSGAAPCFSDIIHGEIIGIWKKQAFHEGGGQFFCNRVKLECDYPSGFHEEGNVDLRISGMRSKSFDFSVNLNTSNRGDFLGSSAANNFQLEIDNKVIQKKMRFLSSSFSFTLMIKSRHGPVFIKSLSFFGERMR